MEVSTDWNLLVQGYLSLNWCQETMKPSNQNKSVSSLLSEFKDKNAGTPPLNLGTMLSAAYLCLMYPQQSEFQNMDFSKIDTSCFIVIEGENGDSKYICRRIRNSLAHARFQIVDDLFVFFDQRTNGKIPFKAEIKIQAFGEFLNSFFFEAKEQHFNRIVT
ncbi:HEPN family nuclease [Photobacterium ganghwense]|uniref:HEPN family nuclease n=1 Tax=Photobacterium ganghwense TaxID=320778 RepID=UPI0039EFB665